MHDRLSLPTPARRFGRACAGHSEPGRAAYPHALSTCRRDTGSARTRRLSSPPLRRSRPPIRLSRRLNSPRLLFPRRPPLHPPHGHNIRCSPCSIIAGHQLAVDETIRYTNQTGVTLSELVLAVEPNLRGGFTLENILLDGSSLTYDLSGQRLTVYLPQPLAPGAQVTLAMRFRISIPPKIKEHPYGYDVDQVNLTDWYPFVVPYSGRLDSARRRGPWASILSMMQLTSK